MGNVYFLVKCKSKIIDYLKKEGFTCTAGNYGCPWYYIDIDFKFYKPGRPGIALGTVIGDHDITFREFVKIYKIYKKYQGKDVLNMDKKVIKNKKIVKKYVSFMPLTKIELDNMTNEEKINRALKIAENYPQTGLQENLLIAEEEGKMRLVDEILMNPNMTISRAMSISYAIVTD